MEHLKQLKIWVCWRYETQKGRRTKVLYNTKGYKTGTSKKYSAQWITFIEAEEALKTHAFDGIGLVLPPGIGGIDMDHMDINGELPQAVRKLMNTYEELSPSGEGIHHLFKVDVTKIPTIN